MSEADSVAVTMPLDSFAILEVYGQDADRFLQGQCTAQLAHANDTFAPLAAFCTPKGRMIANSRIFRPEPERYWLIMHPSIIDALEQHLRKYIVFYKATLTVRTDIILQGIHATADMLTAYTAALPATLPGAWVNCEVGYLLRVEGDSCLIWLGDGECPYAIESTTLSQGDWHRLQINAGIAWLQASQSDAWLPQMINWEALGGISFKKGCYTGQEVVARAHFRGQVKRRLMHLCAADALEAPCVGDAVVDINANREVGTVLAVAPGISEGWEMLAVVSQKKEMPPLSIHGEIATVIDLPYIIERRDPEEMVATLTA